MVLLCTSFHSNHHSNLTQDCLLSLQEIFLLTQYWSSFKCMANVLCVQIVLIPGQLGVSCSHYLHLFHSLMSVSNWHLSWINDIYSICHCKVQNINILKLFLAKKSKF